MLFVPCCGTEQEPHICQGTILNVCFFSAAPHRQVVVSVASWRAFLSLVLSGPHNFCVLLLFLCGVFATSSSAETDPRKEAEMVSVLQLGSGVCTQISMVYKVPEDRMGTTLGTSPLLVAWCIALQRNSKHLTVDACIFVLFWKMGFVSSLCTRQPC